ncbi:MAG: hypothetical protein EP323_07595 [Gammaproteobacteria bacterium]|nr:MAG: hypothetical protein EP323_07595 [Gammaproteobacteria bacterium]
MSDIVFILGAGASKQCGAPLMGDFLDVAHRLTRAGEISDINDHFGRVFRAIGALQAVHSKAQLDLTNIESIFTALEISNVLKRLPGFEADEIPGVIASLKEVIVKTLESTIDFPTSRSHIGVPKPYEQFAELVRHLRSEAHPNQSVSVITFNYDIAVDMALYQHGMGPDYGIPPTSRSHNPVSLFKLHGSLNWAQRKDSGGVYPLQLDQYFDKYRIQSWEERGSCKIPIGSQLREYYSKHTDIDVELEPVIVPPTWNKSDYHHALSTIWGKAAHNLSEAHTIFICGYSLPETDAFFKLLYALGTVGTSPLEKIIVYNPDETGLTNDRFKNMLGPGAIARYEYRAKTFGEAIHDIKQLFPAKK